MARRAQQQQQQCADWAAPVLTINGKGVPWLSYDRYDETMNRQWRCTLCTEQGKWLSCEEPSTVPTDKHLMSAEHYKNMRNWIVEKFGNKWYEVMEVFDEYDTVPEVWWQFQERDAEKAGKPGKTKDHKPTHSWETEPAWNDRWGAHSGGSQQREPTQGSKQQHADPWTVDGRDPWSQMAEDSQHTGAVLRTKIDQLEKASKRAWQDLSAKIDTVHAKLDSVIDVMTTVNEGLVQFWMARNEIAEHVKDVQANVTELNEKFEGARKDLIDQASAVHGNIADARKAVADQMEDVNAHIVRTRNEIGDQVKEVNNTIEGARKALNDRVTELNDEGARKDLSDMVKAVAEKVNEVNEKIDGTRLDFADQVKDVNEKIEGARQDLFDKVKELSEHGALKLDGSWSMIPSPQYNMSSGTSRDENHDKPAADGTETVADFNNGDQVTIGATVHMMVADEPALKEMTSCKGHLCMNVVQDTQRVPGQPTRPGLWNYDASLCSLADPDFSRCRFPSCAEMHARSLARSRSQTRAPIVHARALAISVASFLSVATLPLTRDFPGSEDA